MPTVAKSTSTIAKLGDLSTFSVSSSAIPYETSDSSGSIPAFSATFSGGSDGEFLIGESLTVASPAIGSYSGEVTSVGKARGSGLVNVSADSIMSRLNSTIRAYPLSDYGTGIEYTIMPLYSLEYWTQQCGVFYTAVQGDVLFYQSLYGHFGAFAKNVILPVRSRRGTPVSGGNLSNMFSYGGRVYTGFGRGLITPTAMPVVKGKQTYLPIQVPTGTGPLVFGADVMLAGSGNSGNITWEMFNSNGTMKNALILSVSSDTGFKLQVSQNDSAPATLLTAAGVRGSLYSVYIGITNSSGTDTTYTLTVIDEAGNVTTSTVTIATGFLGLQKLGRVLYIGNLGGAGDELYAANVFISGMQSMPTRRIPDQKALTPGIKGSKFMVGFSGNVWEYVKQFCSIYHLDVGYQGGKLTIGPRPQDITVGSSLSELKTSVTKREQARNVEVVNQNHTATGLVPSVLWKADSVYQVAVGEIQEFTVQTPHSILETSQPVCVSGINPYPYKTGAGQYVVTGSDGYIVSPAFWKDQGGSITTSTTDVEGEIKVTIKGPDFDSPRAPYRISEGDAGRPALYITGLGVLSAPETLKVGTGNGKAAKDVGVTIDSPFIGNAKLAYDAAARAAATFSAPEITVSMAEPLAYDEVSKLGVYPSGKLVKHNGNIFRVTSADQSPSALTGSAAQHNTIYQLNRNFGDTATIGDANTYYAGKTIGQTNIKPIKKVN